MGAALLRVLTTALVFLGPGALSAAEGRPTEYEVKAAFLLNFARFVQWPEGVAQDTLHICIAGQDPFDGAFDKVLGRASGAQPIRLHAFDPAAPEHPCQILFVSQSEDRRLDALLREAAKRPLLTVSDVDGFAGAGGMIGFVIRQNKIRFQINPGAAARADLTLSAKLLRLAEIVDSGDRP